MLLTDQLLDYPRVYVDLGLFRMARQFFNCKEATLERLLVDPASYTRILENCGRLVVAPGDIPAFNYWTTSPPMLSSFTESDLQSSTSQVAVHVAIQPEVLERATQMLKNRGYLKELMHVAD